VEGGILPPGKTTRSAEPLRSDQAVRASGVISAGLEARLYVSQDG